MRTRALWLGFVCSAAAATMALTVSAYGPLIASFVGAAAPTQVDTLDTLGLPGDPVLIMASPHLPTIESAHAMYVSIPPTSGPHVPWTVASGIYRSAIPDELQVHALEHGHVLLQYPPSAGASTVIALEFFARRHPRDVLVAPYPGLSSVVVLTAWGRVERLNEPDPSRIERFIRSHRGRFVHGWAR